MRGAIPAGADETSGPGISVRRLITRVGAALDATLSGKPVTKTSANAFGCSIKRVASKN